MLRRCLLATAVVLILSALLWSTSPRTLAAAMVNNSDVTPYALFLPLVMKDWPLECIPEGGTVPLIPDYPDCCEGLTLIDQAIYIDGGCIPVGGQGVCTFCGDGICGLGENLCNCPEDC